MFSKEPIATYSISFYSLDRQVRPLKTPRPKSIQILSQEPDQAETVVDDVLTSEGEGIPPRILELAEELRAKIASRRKLH